VKCEQLHPEIEGQKAPRVRKTDPMKKELEKKRWGEESVKRGIGRGAKGEGKVPSEGGV